MSVSGAPRKTAVNPRMVYLVLAGVVAVAYVVLGASLLRQQAKQHDLTSQLHSAEAVLATADDVRQQTETLPARVTTANEKLAAAQAAFPSELDSNNILQTILGYASESEVGVISIDALPPATEPADAEPPATEPANAESPTTEPVEETSGAGTLSFDLEVAGDFVQLIAFFKALEEGAASTTRIESFAFQETDGLYVADIELVAYARSSPAEVSSPEADGTAGEGTEAISEGEAGE